MKRLIKSSKDLDLSNVATSPICRAWWVSVGTPLASFKSVWDIVFPGSLCWAKKKKLTIILLIIYISYKYCYVNCIETYFLACPKWRQQLRQLDDCRFHFFYLLNIWVSEFLMGLWLGVSGLLFYLKLFEKSLCVIVLLKGVKLSFYTKSLSNSDSII